MNIAQIWLQSESDSILNSFMTQIVILTFFFLKFFIATQKVESQAQPWFHMDQENILLTILGIFLFDHYFLARNQTHRYWQNWKRK